MKNDSLSISRRKLLAAALQGTGLLVLSGCESLFDRLHQNRRVLSLLESVEGANRRLLRLLTARNKLAQESAKKRSPVISSPMATLLRSPWST